MNSNTREPGHSFAVCHPSSPESRIHALLSVAFLIAVFTIIIVTTAAPGSAASSRKKHSKGILSDAQQQPASATTKARAAENYGKLPLSFEPNRGQAEPTVQFLSREAGYTLFLTGDEAVLALRTSNASPEQNSSVSALRLHLDGANASAKSNGESALPGRSNYFLGDHAANWQAGVPTYSRVRYEDIYPGIDLVYYGNRSGRLEHDFVVRPGADPGTIALNLRGAHSVRLNASGDLELKVASSTLTLEHPVIYQEVKGQRRGVSGGYVLTADGRVKFAVGAYDRSQQLVIDPVLTYSTYLGGSSINSANGIAVDASGNAYITGRTISTNFPVTTGAYDTTCPGECASVFITKLNPAGNALVYSTYLGGTCMTFCGETGKAIAVDASGNAYVTGITSSNNFPTTAGVFQPKEGATTSASNEYTNAFVTKLNATGSALVYSTYLGGSDGGLCYTAAGSEGEGGRSIAVDASGNVYVAGCTESANFPVTSGAFKTKCSTCASGSGHGNGFVSKINATASALVYSTYLGGSGLDIAYGIAIDSTGSAYVAGSATSADFPVTGGAFQTTKVAGGQVAFISKLNATGSALTYSTFLGGNDVDLAYSIALDSSKNAYVTGYASSPDFPVTSSAFQKTCKDCNYPIASSYVAKLNATGSALVYSTFLGGSGDEVGAGIAVNSAGDAFVTGLTESTDFPVTSGSFQTTCRDCNTTIGSSAAFLTELNPTGSALLYSTYLGGSKSDSANAIALDSSGNAYIAGQTASTDFPLSGGDLVCESCAAFDPDGFVSKFSFGTATLTVSFSPTSLAFGNQKVGTSSAAKVVTLTNSGNTTLTLTAINFSGTYTGGYTGSTTCTASLAAGASCTVTVTFAPTSAISYPATLNFYDNANGDPQQVPITGTGVTASGPVVTLQPTSLSFSGLAVGSSSMQSVTLTNTGTSALTISSIAITGTNASLFTQTNNCSTSVAATKSCSIAVTFKPTASGSFSASVVITDNASPTQQTVALTGSTSGTAPAVTLTPTSLAFGAQAVGIASASKTVTLKNTGTAPLTISAAGFGGTDPSDFTGSTTCTTTVAAGATCAFTISFKPTTVGARSATLVVDDNAGSGSQSVPLTGTGTYAELSPASLTFAAQTVGTTSAAQTVTLTNLGTTAISISSISLTGTNGADFAQTHTCGTSLAAGAKCTISVTFKPTAKGARSATLSVADNAGGSPQSTSLSGTGQ